MAKFKKLFSLLMVCVLGGSFALTACDGGTGENETAEEHGKQTQELALFQSDYKFTPEQRMSRIKAEYLIENQGYKDDDKVVAILSLKGDALIDSYLADEELSGKMSLSEYASTPMGVQRKNAVSYAQTDLIRSLQSDGLIESVNYQYSVVANAVAVNTTYASFLEIEERKEVAGAALAETYNRPQEAGGTDASAIENVVDVYETGIFNSESAKDPNGESYTGKGTSVAVLDSGFDLSHAVFNTHKPEGELMFTRAKIDEILKTKDTRAEGFTQDLKVSDVYYSDKIPFKYDYADKDSDVFPFDSEHGTHVAGIIGGYAESYTDKDGNPVVDENGAPIEFKGIAKDTQLVLMKVFPDLSEGAETDDILAALEDAVLLGVDAINMSLGSACGFAREKDGDVINTVYDKINESGVSLVTAASNNYSSAFGGAQGNTNFVTNPDTGTIGSPSTYAPALSVASINGIKSKYIIGNGSRVFFFNESNSIAGEENDFFGELYAAQGWDKTDGETHELQYIAVPGYGKRADYTTIKGEIQGKIALVSRGDNTFEDKALQAKNAGAAACIIYNNIDGDILMSMGKSGHIPTISISKEDGVALAKTRRGTLTISYDQQAGPFMSDFSSWGPLPDLTLKPEITAHGGNITSSVPGGGFDQISGTSMACPNMCGVVVLIRQFIKDNYGKFFKDYDANEGVNWKAISVLTNQMLMSTATIIHNEQDNPYSPRKQGAGLASLSNVVNTRAYLKVEENGKVKDRSKLELMDDPEKKGVYEMEFDVVNVSDAAAEYELKLIGMTESVSTSDNDHVAERGQLLSGGFKAESVSGEGTVNGTKVTVNAGGELKVKVTYTLSQEDKDTIENLFPYGMYVEGFVQLIAAEESDVDLNIPFLAFYGDWSQAPIFDKTYYEVESEAHNAGIDDEDKIKADYYATTPYGSYFYNYIIPLGAYLYDIDESTYDAIPGSEEHIAISNSLGCIDGISSVYAGLLRGCKEMTYTITDKVTGEVVYEYVLTNAHKAFSQGGSPIPNYEFLRINAYQLGLQNNRQYEFKMVGKLDYAKNDGLNTNVRNTFSFDFTLDTEAPIIRSATYEKEYDKRLKKDRYYINLTVYDNHYAMALTPLIFANNPDYDGTQNSAMYEPVYLLKNPVPVYGDRASDSIVRIEITDFLENNEYTEMVPSALAFTIEDYALNQNLYVCPLPGTRGDFKFTNDGTMQSGTKSILSINEGDVVDLTYYLASGDATLDANKDYLRYLIWESDKPTCAAVSEGKVVGLKAGKAKITVTENWMGASASITVNVRAKATGTSASVYSENSVSPIATDQKLDLSTERIKSIRFAYLDTIFAHARAGQTSDIGSTGDRVLLTSLNGGLSMYPGEQFKLYYDLDPWYVADKYNLTFASNNPDVLDVTEDGVVSALKKGNAIVTLSVEGSNLMAALSVSVNSEFVIDEARTLVAYKGRGGEVVIPDDEGILYIGPYSFSLYETNYQYGQELPDDDIYANRIPQVNNTITSVVVPNGVMEIQQYAFYNCTKLISVELPDTVKFLRQYVFYGDVALQTINLEHVEAIGAHAFEQCAALDNIQMPDMYTIGTAGFKDCIALAYVDLTTLRNAGEEAFMGCKGLKSVKLGALTKLAPHIFDGCGLESVTVYESDEIPDYAFANNPSLGTVTLAAENGLNHIGEGAFSGDAGLQTVTLPNSAFTMGGNVFAGCSALNTVGFQTKTAITSAQGAILTGTSVENFEVASDSEFYKTSTDGHQLLNKNGTEIVLAAVKAYENQPLTVDAGIARVGDGAFGGAKITALTFQSPVEVGAYAFADCELLQTVTFAGSGNTVGTRAFNNCAALESVVGLDTVATVGDYGFAITPKLQSAKLAANVAAGTGAFFRSGIATVEIGAGAHIGLGAFQRCDNLVTVTMPQEGGVVFGALCFSNDTKLAEIDLSKAAGEIGDECFFGCTALREANLAHITRIGIHAFANCHGLATVTLGEELESIGEGAFMDYASFINPNTRTPLAPAFTEIVLPASLKMFGDGQEDGGAGIFYGCVNLSKITIPDGIEAIPDYMFTNCLGLRTVNLPASCVKIGGYAFAGCSALETVGLSHVKEFGEYAFISAGHHDTGMGSEYYFANADIQLTAAENIGFAAFADTAIGGAIVAPALKSVGQYAFQNATFTSFSAPLLEEIGAAAFQGNAALAAFNFSDRIASVGSYAFLGCTSLTAFTYGTSAAKDGKINDYAKLVDGVLYTAMKSGKQQLSSVPAGKNIATLTVEEGTSRIDAYAANANSHISTVVLPDSLETIGNYAFFGCNVLKTVEFRSVSAPALESDYDAEAQLSERDPGYDILHNQYDLYQYALGYYNFIDLVGKNEPINMILPANADEAGYGNVIYLVYFGPVANAKRSDYVAMEQNMKDFLQYAKQVKEIGTVTMADEKIVSKAVTALNGVKQNPADYGYSEQEWNEMRDLVLKANSDLARLKIANAKKAVRDIQARIDGLPDAYDPSLDATIEALRDDIATLVIDDRGLLIQDKYTKLLNAYETAHTQTPSEGDGEGGGNGESDSGCGSVIGLYGGVAAGAIVLAAAAVAVFSAKKKND